MSKRIWHDLLSVQPPDGAVVTIQRAIVQTPPIPAEWADRPKAFFFGTRPDIIPWWAVSAWRTLVPSGPVWPLSSDDLRWRDPCLYQPADLQNIWVRRWPPDTAAAMAVYSSGIYMVHDWVLPFFQVWMWKPAGGRV